MCIKYIVIVIFAIVANLVSSQDQHDTSSRRILQVGGGPYRIRMLRGIGNGPTFLSATPSGDLVNLRSVDDNSGRQRWIFRNHGSYYNILISKGVSTNMVYLSVKGDGSKVDLYSFDDGSGRQRWVLKQIPGNNMYNIMIFGGVTGGNRFLSCSSDASVVDLYTVDDGSGRQQWHLVNLNPSSPAPTTLGPDPNKQVSSGCNFIKQKPDNDPKPVDQCIPTADGGSTMFACINSGTQVQWQNWGTSDCSGTKSTAQSFTNDGTSEFFCDRQRCAYRQCAFGLSIWGVPGTCSNGKKVFCTSTGATQVEYNVNDCTGGIKSSSFYPFSGCSTNGLTFSQCNGGSSPPPGTKTSSSGSSSGSTGGSSSGKKGSSTVGIVLGVLGGICCLVCVGAALFLVMRQRNSQSGDQYRSYNPM